MDPKGKGIVINDKEKESFVNEPKDDKPTDSGSGHKCKDGKKKKTRCIKEIVYYDDSDESTSSQKDNDDNDYDKRKTVNLNFSFDYSHIPHSSNAHLLSIPLGKPPVGTCSPVQGDPTGVSSNVNRVLARDGNSPVNLASQGHCAGVFIGI
jgi:hypothetical protein